MSLKSELKKKKNPKKIEITDPGNAQEMKPASRHQHYFNEAKDPNMVRVADPHRSGHRSLSKEMTKTAFGKKKSK